MTERAPIAVALDTPDLATATRVGRCFAPYVSTLKVGLELFDRYGSSRRDRRPSGAPSARLFLDVKLHDIPATVAGAARALAPLEPEFVTVHCLGGPAMIEAAVDALPATRIAGVTVLTSMSAADLDAVGIGGVPLDAVRRLAGLAVDAGARALVCSPQEVAAVRAEVGPDIVLITPGVRPASSASDDQARVATPQQALADGADLLVIGRPITAASDPRDAAAAITATLAG